jgi:hypothetical protein
MTQFVSGRLAAQLQRRTAGYSYTDSAIYISTISPDVLDAYGQPSATATEEFISCSFTDRPNAERWRGDVDVEMIAAEIRFDSETTPTKGGMITVTHKFGLPITERTYQIIGIQNRSQLGYICALKAVSI